MPEAVAVMAGRGEPAARWLAKVLGVMAVVTCGVEDWWDEGVGRCLVEDGVAVAMIFGGDVVTAKQSYV